MSKVTVLRQSLSLPVLVMYGLGNILGAGIYVLIGQVAGFAGYNAPLAFIIAFAVAALTAFSYTELSSRYPKSAGVPIYLHQAFGRRRLSTLAGLLLVATGIVSAATLLNGFAGYFQAFAEIPKWLGVVSGLVVLTIIAVSGMVYSARLAVTLTLIEVFGLLLIIGIGLRDIPVAEEVVAQAFNFNAAALPGILFGAFLAFYAFIGFEDMVDVIEEVKAPSRTMPRAILVALAIATALYLLVIISALAILSPLELAASSAPLSSVFAAVSGSFNILTAIGLAATINGALVQIIMGSRMLYGMANQGWIHRAFGLVHGSWRTPALSTIAVSALVLVLALSFPLLGLAEATSFLILVVFALVNASLLVIKRKSPEAEGAYIIHRLVPALGFMASLGMLIAAVL